MGPLAHLNHNEFEQNLPALLHRLQVSQASTKSHFVIEVCQGEFQMTSESKSALDRGSFMGPIPYNDRRDSF